MKRAIIVHGWDGTPTTGWFPWLKQKLEEQGFKVAVPQLPETDKPRIENWVPALASAVGEVDEDTYFVGHSMGCQTIARYLETLPEGTTVGGVVYVAGFFRPITGLETEEEKEIDRSWYSTPIDLEKVRSHAPKSIALFSDNDPFVPLENVQEFRDALQSEIIVEHDANHFNEGSGCYELPIALESVLKLAS